MKVLSTKPHIVFGLGALVFTILWAASVWFDPWVHLVLLFSSMGLLALLWRRPKTPRLPDPAPGRVRLALDVLSEGLLIIDAEGRIVLANHAFATLVGESSVNLLGRLSSELPWLAADENKPEQYLPWRTSLQQNRRHEKVIRLAVGPSDVRRFVVDCSPVDDEDGQCCGVLASFRDITKQQEKNEPSEYHEVTGVRDSATSEFFSHISLEISARTKSILSSADLMRQELLEHELPHLEYLDRIESDGKYTLQVIDECLELLKASHQPDDLGITGTVSVSHGPVRSCQVGLPTG